MITSSLRSSLLQVKVPDAEQFVGQPQGAPITGAQLDARARTEIAGAAALPGVPGDCPSPTRRRRWPST